MLAISYKPLKSLIPYARNARVHSRAQIQKIKASLVEFGWGAPMVTAEDSMLAGHGRLLAALELAEAAIPIPHNEDIWAGPAVDVSYLSPAQRRAYILADNRLAEEATWDDALLQIELSDLDMSGFDLTLTGFDSDEITRLLTEPQGGPGEEEGNKTGTGTLAARFGVPPFTVLNAREGWWQDRKRAWLALGIRSEVGRGDILQGMSESTHDYMYNKSDYVGRPNAEPAGSKRAAADYSKTKARGGGRGRSVDGT